MPANVSENPVVVRAYGAEVRRTTGFTAWCDRCEDEMTGVNWRGSTFPVGYHSAPAMEARIEAELHNEEWHAAAQHEVVIAPMHQSTVSDHANRSQ